MMQKDLIDKVEEILKTEIRREAKKGELAYLALTSKIEQNLRDRLAVSLQLGEFNNEIVVSREYPRGDFSVSKKGGRIDLVLFSKGKKPILFLEFKACYSFDLIKSNNSDEYIVAVRKDMIKSLEVQPEVPMYSILFITHPLEFISNDFSKVIKYEAAVNRYLKLYKEKEIIKNAELKLKSSFEGVHFGSIIENDSALDQRVSLFYGIIKKQLKK
mgnify:FL=1